MIKPVCLDEEAAEELDVAAVWYEERRPNLLQRFPYSIVFIELEDELRVLAIAHGSRQPGYWRARL
jgi:hypothetical protein